MMLNMVIPKTVPVFCRFILIYHLGRIGPCHTICPVAEGARFLFKGNEELADRPGVVTHYSNALESSTGP